MMKTEVLSFMLKHQF